MSRAGGSARPRVGVREVAVAAGVSTQTVSRVINGHPYIRDDTRQRVLDAMAALDYRVNNAARSLITRESRTVGVIVSGASLFGPAAGVTALEAAAREVGRWIVTGYADADEDASVDRAVEHLLDQGVDGLVLVGLHARTREAIETRAQEIPLVALHGEDGRDAQRAAAVLGVDHLAMLGHRRIARLGGPAEWIEESARAEGFAQAVRKLGLQVVREWSGDWSAAAGAAVCAEVAASVRSAGGPTAIVVANDQMALGLMAGLGDLGVAVPDEVSVIGFDDNPDAAFYRPSLSTLRVDVEAEARRCIAALFAQPSGGELPSPALVARASTAPPR